MRISTPPLSHCPCDNAQIILLHELLSLYSVVSECLSHMDVILFCKNIVHLEIRYHKPSNFVLGPLALLNPNYAFPSMQSCGLVLSAVRVPFIYFFSRVCHSLNVLRLSRTMVPVSPWSPRPGALLHHRQENLRGLLPSSFILFEYPR